MPKKELALTGATVLWYVGDGRQWEGGIPAADLSDATLARHIWRLGRPDLAAELVASGLYSPKPAIPAPAEEGLTDE